MPSLDWIGKRAVVNHHREVPTRLLHCDGKLSYGDPDAGNLLVQGDNLEALKALLPYYAGAVKCIYIDPPYNTGNEGWVYNDNVNSPEIRAWLNAVVGKEGEDLSRHDKWLCMMYPRARLLRDLLSDTGSLWVSIDDHSFHIARSLLDEIFGASNFVATVVWHKMDSPKNSAIHFSEDHEYILVYARNAKTWRPNGLPRTDEMNARYKNPDNDPRGVWLLSDLAARNFYADGRYSITTPSGRVIEGPPAGSYWRISRAKFDELEADGRIWWGKGNSRPGIKRFLTDVRDTVVPQTLWSWRDVGSTRHSKRELSEAMEAKAATDLFVTPKPVNLIKRILQIATQPGDLVLDSFAGSGTTAVAVAELGESRRCILTEMDPDICSGLTAERLRRKWSELSIGELSEGGGFRYCDLGKPIFDEWGAVNQGVTFADLAAFVFFSDTGSPIPKKASGKTPLLGTFQDRAIYILFSPETLGVADEAAGNVLTLSKLDSLPLPAPGWSGPRVVYAEGCTVPPDRLAAAGVTFKQVPYQLAAS